MYQLELLRLFFFDIELYIKYIYTYSTVWRIKVKFLYIYFSSINVQAMFLVSICLIVSLLDVLYFFIVSKI